jgi:hypothetical protein
LLGAALLFAAVIALCASAALEGGLAFARVSARHAAQHYAGIGLVRARSQLLAAIGSQVAGGAQTLTAPPPLAPTPLCDEASSACPFTLSATYALTGALAEGGTANVSAGNVQTLPAIAEDRLAATIVATVSTPAGTPLVVRTEWVTLRTFSVPPYAALDGVTDAAASRDVTAEADAAGCDPASWSACDANNVSPGMQPAPAGSMNPGDTRIHALRACADGGTGRCAGQAYVSADPANAPSATPWFNANAQPRGWSP